MSCPTFHSRQCFLRPLISFWLVVVTALTGGCKALHLPDFPDRSVEQQPYKAFQDGLAVGMKPIVDAAEARTYFGTDLLSENILPVAVTVENRSVGSSYILEKERFRLGNSGAGEGVAKGKRSGENVGTAIALLGGIGTMPLGAKLASDARVIRHNLVTKELQATTINPGSVVRGFLFFELPAQTPINGDWIIHLEALDLKVRQYATIEIPFNWNRK